MEFAPPTDGAVDVGGGSRFQGLSRSGRGGGIKIEGVKFEDIFKSISSILNNLEVLIGADETVRDTPEHHTKWRSSRAMMVSLASIMKYVSEGMDELDLTDDENWRYALHIIDIKNVCVAALYDGSFDCDTFTRMVCRSFASEYDKTIGSAKITEPDRNGFILNMLRRMGNDLHREITAVNSLPALPAGRCDPEILRAVIKISNACLK